MGKFFLALFFAAAIIGVCMWFGAAYGLFPKPSFLFKTLIFLTFSTGLIYVYLYKARRDLFLQLYLLTMVVKLLAYCIYNLIVVLQDKASATMNVVFFMVAYFIFTVLETGFLYRKITGHDKP